MNCLKIKTGYNGQRYEVRFEDGAVTRVFGWTNSPDGEPFVSSVNEHPYWKNPQVIDLHDPSAEDLDTISNEELIRRATQ